MFGWSLLVSIPYLAVTLNAPVTTLMSKLWGICLVQDSIYKTQGGGTPWRWSHASLSVVLWCIIRMIMNHQMPTLRQRSTSPINVENEKSRWIKRGENVAWIPLGMHGMWWMEVEFEMSLHGPSCSNLHFSLYHRFGWAPNLIGQLSATRAMTCPPIKNIFTSQVHLRP